MTKLGSWRDILANHVNVSASTVSSASEWSAQEVRSWSARNAVQHVESADPLSTTNLCQRIARYLDGCQCVCGLQFECIVDLARHVYSLDRQEREKHNAMVLMMGVDQ